MGENCFEDLDQEGYRSLTKMPQGCSFYCLGQKPCRLEIPDGFVILVRVG